jgi:7-keto-8-aminopelargonate synthetase-like enzyme
MAAAVRSTLRWHGLNVAASRMTTGNHAIYQELETALAKFFGAETALVFPDGYMAPMAVAQALAGEFTDVLMDELSHGALLDAAKLLGCAVKKFKHRDVEDLQKAVRRCGKKARVIVLTDGMFAHDGSAAPLKAYLKVLPAGGMILVDDAHGAGVLGRNGRGTLELEGVGRSRIVQCATLSKAFGAYGGVVLASEAIHDRVRARSRMFMGTTPIPLPLAGAGLAALKILRAEPERRARLMENAWQFRKALRSGGWEVADVPGPIVRLPPIVDRDAEKLSKRLLAAGIYPPFLKYGSAQGAFRFVISSEHTAEQLGKVAGVVRDT